jgi:putative transposase
MHVSERRACAALGQHHSTQRKVPRGRDDEERLTADIIALARQYGRYGYRKIAGLLEQAGWIVNDKRVERIWRREGLIIRSKLPRRKRAWRYRSDRPIAGEPNEIWAMDFMADQLFDGRSFRILTIVDCHTREALAIAPRVNFRAFQVVVVLDQLVRSRGKPQSQRDDNGPEFAGRMLDQWAYLNGIELDFSRPGTPTDNAFIEAFNARIRAECLMPAGSSPWPMRGSELKNGGSTTTPSGLIRPLGHLTPQAFARQAATARKIS